MSGDSLDWRSKTNTNVGSCRPAQCNCIQFLQIYQQEVMKRVSNLVSSNNYELEPGYEARARRISSVYAKIFLETEVGGDPTLLGRYYWMGLGAFASKTVAMVFSAFRSQTAYLTGMLNSDDALNAFAKGNLWLFMDISVWHYLWSASPTSFAKCKGQRNTQNFVDLRTSMNNMPWSSSLSKLNYLRVTPEINSAFGLLPSIESKFKFKSTTDGKFKAAKKVLLTHILYVAVQEQKNILQKIAWEDASLQTNVKSQRGWFLSKVSINQTLALSSDYNVNTLKKRRKGTGRGRERLGGDAKSLPEDPWSAPPKGTILENYDSRMVWINKVAEKYHTLMLDTDGREFLISELRVIATWGNSRETGWIFPSSNPTLNLK
ncbi:DUF2515 family protein [Psychrobacter sp. FME6]|uniref:DUF2515 family protein n=2 Tax=Psychrobacter TaxID=497 RepID=UPI00178833A9|nr:hypothetical protein [Psychrobacter sp. FME6]MBE0407991.1 hypothetical protein [Psychrobacter sp. FME6]